ncbi:hypothetical protein IT401_02815 [Candidatus Nomurabacteria bacterium]|nr:hypothetical protein [Candidatus Nomurabacteria bacterium]
MADDKGGSGGSGWGVLEIGLVVLLIMGVLNQFSGKGSSSDNMTSGDSSAAGLSQVQPITEDPQARCGLSLTRPVDGTKVNVPIVLEGTVGSCNWRATESTALYAQVIDTNGKSLTEYLAVPPSAAVTADAVEIPFSERIALLSIPKTSKGYLILVPAIPPDSSTSLSLRIPVTFVR